MPFQSSGDLRYFTFENLATAPVTQAVFTRHGGYSRGPYAELNVGATVGDELDPVRRNVKLAFESVGRARESLFDSWLVHGTNALLAEAPRPPEVQRPPQADIILTNKPEVSLFMRYADCVPLLFYDPVQHAIALAHAGWKGSVEKVAAEAVRQMQQHFDSQPADLVVGVGPSISPERYEIGPEVVEQVESVFDADGGDLLPDYNGSTHFDLWAANLLTLAQSGVANIELAGICTATNTDDWFSHRAEGGRTGRFGVLLALDER